MVLCPAEAFVSIVGRVRFLNEYYVVALLESKLEGGAVSSSPLSTFAWNIFSVIFGGVRFAHILFTLTYGDSSYFAW